MGRDIPRDKAVTEVYRRHWMVGDNVQHSHVHKDGLKGLQQMRVSQPSMGLPIKQKAQRGIAAAQSCAAVAAPSTAGVGLCGGKFFLQKRRQAGKDKGLEVHLSPCGEKSVSLQFVGDKADSTCSPGQAG